MLVSFLFGTSTFINSETHSWIGIAENERDNSFCFNSENPESNKVFLELADCLSASLSPWVTMQDHLITMQLNQPLL